MIHIKRKTLKIQLTFTSNYYVGQTSQVINQINNSNPTQKNG